MATDSGGNKNNDLIRVTRIGKLYRLVKLSRLLRVAKIVKQKNQILKYINDALKMSLGFERLFFFVIVFMLLCHICACLWIIMAKIVNDEYKGTWMESIKYNDDGTATNYSNNDIYTMAVYWTITTITTVGYGDVSITNYYERIFCSLLMIIGVIAFSLASGSLTSIISNYDNANAEYACRLTILNKARAEYKLPIDLYIRLKKSLNFERDKDIEHLHKFVETLPKQLKVEMSLYIYEKRYANLKFFENTDSISLITWMCSLLSPSFYSDKEMIFFEGEPVTQIHFLIKGVASFVLPSFKNMRYITIEKGDHYGIIDIIGSIQAISDEGV